jgi:hypothetical protein
MGSPTEHRTVQARILEYAEAIGWTLVSQKAVYVLRLRRAKDFCRRGLNRRERRGRREDQDFESLSSLRSLWLAISEFFEHEEKRERDLIPKRKRRFRGFPDTAFRPGIPSPERLKYRDHKEDFDSGSLSSLRSLRLVISGFKGFDRRERRDRKVDLDSGSLSSLCSLRYFISATACCRISTPVETL